MEDGSGSGSGSLAEESALDLSRMWVYIAGTAVFLALLLLSSTLLQIGGARAAEGLHNDCVAALLRAPVWYYEKTPSGRFTSRFSADVANVDQALGQMGDNFLQFTFTILALYVVVCLVMPVMLIMAVLVSAGCYFQIVAVDRSSREAKRMANADMAPCLTDVSETIDGRLVLRHCSGERSGATTDLAPQFFASRFDGDLSNFLTSNFVASSLVNWSQLIAYVVSFLFSVACASCVVVQADELTESASALALSYAFQLPYFLMFYGFIINNLKVALTALERLLELLMVPQEPAWSTEFDERHPAWPASGSIELKGVSMRYGTGLPLAVSAVDASVRAGERIGLCGRTGAGKSSLISLLFRLVEPCAGRVLIDGVDISTVGLMKLRRCMAVIPQQPLLMDGTLRYNLDPFGDFGDEELAEILELLALPKSITLDTPIGGGARGSSGLSAGQRQLLNVGRTLLRKVPIVVMDEPTSNIDSETDARIQRRLIRGRLGAATTVLTIAHRLNTIADYDRVWVMDRGGLVEEGRPAELLDREGSLFRAMAAHMGEEQLQALRARAAAKVAGP